MHVLWGAGGEPGMELVGQIAEQVRLPAVQFDGVASLLNALIQAIGGPEEFKQELNDPFGLRQLERVLS